MVEPRADEAYGAAGRRPEHCDVDKNSSSRKVFWVLFLAAWAVAMTAMTVQCSNQGAAGAIAATR
ncbi:MAG TPA: hypothetical protein VG841_15010 [Caulobacterales bacterium]|nr:hypothetical protein [Caulobacterales bacterium]